MALFAPTVAFGWVYDDQMEIVLNTFVHSLRYLPEVFSSSTWAGSGMETYLYRPLSSATYALNHSLSGLEPWSYHLVNVLLHAGCSILVFRIGRLWKLPTAVAGVGALLFAVHPAHVEVVAAVFGRKDLLATLFTLAMVLGHRAAIARGGWRVILPVAAFAAAILSKEVGLVALPLVAAHDWFLEPDRKRFLNLQRVPGLYIGYLAVLLGFILIRNQVVGGFGISGTSFFDNPLVMAGPLSRSMTALVVLARGLGLLAAPVVLSPDYSFDAIPLVESVADPRFLGAMVLFGFIAGWTWWRKNQGLILPLALLWYILAVLPTSNLFFTVGTIFGERLLYLPSVAFCFLSAYGLSRIQRWSPNTAGALLVSALALWGGQTIRYSRAWEGDIPLFSWAVTQIPNSTKAHHKLGEEQLRAGRLGDAVRSLRRSLEIAPANEFAVITLSQATRQIGDRHLPDLTPLPTDPDILFVLGQILQRQGDLDGAATLWEEAVRQNPLHAAALTDLGVIWTSRADTARGMAYLEEAGRAKPSFAMAWFHLGRIRLAKGDSQAAQEALDRFIETAGPQLEYEVRWARIVLGTLGTRKD